MMLPYEQRLAEAEAYHAASMERVRTTPAPAGQKYPVGSFVKISGNERRIGHSKYACVEHTHAHAFGGNDWKSYSLNIQCDVGDWITVAWFNEEDLTPVTDETVIAELQKDLNCTKE